MQGKTNAARNFAPRAVAIGAVFAFTMTGTFAGTSASAGSIPKRPSVERVSDWLNPTSRTLSDREVREKIQLARALQTRQGSGTYICSPSGFGKRSRCSKR